MQFTTGLELFQAMIGGSLDVLSTGAVVSNFPARGQGKVFLINNVEYATAQLWVRDDAIKTLADLKGQQISTTTGTTAHVFLDNALRSAKLDPAKDVQTRQPAHGRGGDLVHLGRGAGGGAVGALRCDRCAEDAGRAQARRCVGVSTRRPPSSAAGRPATTTTTRTRPRWPAGGRLGRGQRPIVAKMDAAPRCCRRRSTRTCRWPTSRSSSSLQVLHLGRVARQVRRRHRHASGCSR
jgi:hypothetical protein